MITLHTHQDDAVDHLLQALSTEGARSGTRWTSVVMPTASGKTIVVQVALRLALRRRDIRGALVVTPMQHTEDAFALGHRVSYRPSGAKRRRQLSFSESSWVVLRRSEQEGDDVRDRDRDRERERVHLRCRRTLLEGSPGKSPAILTTHAQAIRCYKLGVFPPDLSGWIFVLDEGHHGGEDGTVLYDLAEEWHRRGGIVWTVTATPFRSDRRPIAPTDLGVRPFVVTYAELQSKGLLPRIRLRVIEIASEGRPAGRLLDADVERIVDLVAAEREGGVDRTTIVNVASGEATTLSRKFVAAFRNGGYAEEAVHDAVGESDKVRDATRSMLARERQIARSEGYGATGVRVVVSCKRFGEGADFPTCSHVVSVGISTSLVSVVQHLGRGARSKESIPGYPAVWKDEVLFTLLVPKLEDSEEESLRQSARLVQIACALQCSDTALDLQVFWEDLVRNFRLPPAIRMGRPGISRLGALSCEELADARWVGLEAAAWLEEITGEVPSIGEVVDEIERRLGRDGAHVITKLLELVSDDHADLADAMKEAMARVFEDLKEAVETGRMAEEPEIRNLYREALHGAMLDVATRYRTLSCTVDLQIARGFEGRLCGADMRRIVLDVEKGRNQALDLSDEDLVRNVIDPYRRRYGRMPDLKVGDVDISVLTGTRHTLQDYDRHLRRSGFDLARLSVCRSWVLGDLLSEDELRTKVKPEWLSRLAERDWSTPGAIAVAMNQSHLDLSRVFRRPEHLLGLDLASRRGWRGLEGRMPLLERLERSGAGNG